MSRYPGRNLAMKLIAGIVFLLVFMGFMQSPGSSDPGRTRPPPD